MPMGFEKGDFVSWDSSGGRARGQIERIATSGSINVPDSSVTIEASEDDPAALIRLYRGGEATDVRVGHKLSTLTKISAIKSDSNGLVSNTRVSNGLVSNELDSNGLEVKHAFLDLELKEEEVGGVFVGYGSTFGNKDQGNDIVVAGAFANAVKMHKSGKRKVKLLYQHDMKMPIGVIDEMREDDKGLYMKGRLLVGQGVAKADEAYALMKNGAIDGLSIGYRIQDSDITRSGVRKIKQADLLEVSVVTFPMNERATVASIKSEPEITARAVERILREEGYSRNAAKAIANGGVKSLSIDECDAQKSDEVNSLLTDISKQLRSIVNGNTGVKTTHK